jgi:hypothetical protein
MLRRHQARKPNQRHPKIHNKKIVKKTTSRQFAIALSLAFGMLSLLSSANAQQAPTTTLPKA